MDDEKKKQYINKHINLLDLTKKYELCNQLKLYHIDLNQNNNGVYIHYNKLDSTIINIIYHFVKSNM
jgi:hypothetical protein